MELLAVDLGALVGVSGEGVSDLSLLGDLSRALDELVVDLFLNEESAAGNAALTLVEEETNLGLSDSNINVSIVHDNVG